MCIPSESGRFAYFFCRYMRTDEIKHEGHGYLVNKSTGALSSLPRAPVYVYRLKRVSPALMLTRAEAMLIQEAMTEEGQPILLSMAAATEGKEL